MYTKQNKVEIERAIMKKRELMIESARTYGFTNEITLKHSQELDILINEYMRFFRKSEAKTNFFYTTGLKGVYEPSAIVYV